MYPIPETLPISELRHAQAQVIGRLSNGPIVLTQRGRAAAILVDPAMWNRLLEQLEDLQDTVDGLEALAEYRKDPSTTRPLSDVLYDFNISERVLAEEGENYG